MTVSHKKGKITPESILKKLKIERAFGKHSTSPRVLSIAQPTEVGTVYSIEELSALSRLCKAENLFFHLDGGRLYNAAAHLEISLEEIVGAAQVDILSLGGTKNGLMGVEALLIFQSSLEEGSDHLQKQTLQLLSKMRYLSSQYIPFFKDELWRTLAIQANQKTQEIASIIKTIPQLSISYPAETNQIFFTAPKSWIPLIQEEIFCYPWDQEKNEIRFITSWNTSTQDIRDVESILIKISNMNQIVEHQKAKFFIGLELRASIEDALLKSVLQGRFDTFHSSSICSPLPEADFKETNQNCVYAWGMDYVCGNGVMEKDPNRIPTEQEINQTIQYFSAKNLPFMWWTSAKILETKGFQFGGILTGIALDISEGVPPTLPASSDLKVKIVKTESELKSFTDLAADAFAMSPKATEQWLTLNDAVMKKGEHVHFIAYLNGVPVGTATLSVSPSSAGIWNLATLPRQRKHGIGRALVHAALVEAKKRQYEQVMAILMPKGLAWGLFTKLSFKAICEFPFYMYGISAAELEK